MKSNYDYDIIRDYLHGLVDQETARRIRDLIRNDDVARNIATGILQLEHDFNGNDDEVDSYIDGLLQKQLKLIHKKEGTSNTWIKMAAAILLVAVAGSAAWLMQGNNVLDDELSEPYPFSSDRGTSTGAGFEAYIKGNYNSAINSFDINSADATVIFYNGLSHLYAGKYNEAVTLLGSLGTSRYNQQAFWFQTLALIKAGKTNEGRRNLQIISNYPSHYKSGAARELLSALED
jgi:hypothetical protein